MIDFCRKVEARQYFKSVLEEQKDTNVKAVFSFEAAFSDTEQGCPVHFADGTLYILFEDDRCLVIDYLYTDELNVQHRTLTESEAEKYGKLREKDFFNTVQELRDFRTAQVVCTETRSLEYGSIVDVALRSVTEEYEKWIKHRIDVVTPTEETFDAIRFTMSNGNRITICPADAEMDRYIMVWSEDAIETKMK